MQKQFYDASAIKRTITPEELRKYPVSEQKEVYSGYKPTTVPKPRPMKTTLDLLRNQE